MNVDKGDAVTRTEYKPYGETWIQEGDKTNRPKFNSQELDPETGYYFYNARYYEAEIGRFVTADNIIPEEYSTQSWNRFSYCKGNPVRYKDPTGHDPADEISNFLSELKGVLEESADSQLSVAKETASSGDIVAASYWGFCGAANKAVSFFLPEDRSDIDLALLTAFIGNPAVVKTAKKGVKNAEKALESVLKTNTSKKISKNSDNVWSSGQKLIEQISEKYGDDVARKIVPSKLPHNNKTLGHWDTIVNVGIKEAMNPEVKKVFLNKGLSNVVDLAKGQKNRRLDVLTEKMNGIIDVLPVF
ncbi:MAG TPA: RHS repeat-associated core domain-containing protein [Spirochaetota bacterium]|nr:RHS repeat-associated core domain-containing protein [Spirochaetota bacterium]HPY04052.1 RHS repeat-associated core domain-containing protein [Spirochaetota bacterium]